MEIQNNNNPDSNCLFLFMYSGTTTVFPVFLLSDIITNQILYLTIILVLITTFFPNSRLLLTICNSPLI